MKLLVKGLQLVCDRLAEPEASEAREACKRLAKGSKKTEMISKIFTFFLTVFSRVMYRF